MVWNSFFFVQARYYRMHNRDAGIFLFLPSKKKIHDLDFFLYYLVEILSFIETN